VEYEIFRHSIGYKSWRELSNGRSSTAEHLLNCRDGNSCMLLVELPIGSTLAYLCVIDRNTFAAFYFLGEISHCQYGSKAGFRLRLMFSYVPRQMKIKTKLGKITLNVMVPA
jgi:hypothetical protein